ncbi:hypothetical protein F5Y05DRAFT_361971 [Hypoxylon sp. FL0543]|nr:hypothetical protein F5Y05DRAFT_361971 [Hypoxylon sp. FL0543]
MPPRLPKLSLGQACRQPICHVHKPFSQPSIHAPFTTSAARTAIRADQTRKSNDPSEEQKEGHHKQAKKTTSGEDRDHPAKQPDPQPSPSKPTGVRSEGPESKSGEGSEPAVHKEKGAGAGQHTG